MLIQSSHRPATHTWRNNAEHMPLRPFSRGHNPELSVPRLSPWIEHARCVATLLNCRSGNATNPGGRSRAPAAGFIPSCYCSV